MLNRERMLGTSSLFFKLVALTAREKVSKAERKPGRLTNSFIIKDYSRLLGMDPEESEKTGVNKIVLEVIDYWFWADSYLDSQPPRASFGIEEIYHKGVSDKHRFQKVENTIIDSSLSQQKKDELRDLIVEYKERAIYSHFDFISDFEPLLASYGSVLNYRQQTSGDMGEMLTSIIGISAGAKDEDIKRIMGVARKEILGLQMIDDMVDSVSDFGQLPNLFNALLVEEPNEVQQFLEAISSENVILSKKPYQIAESFSPKTLAVYIDRFKEMIDELPKERRNLLLQFMAIATYCSYTPGEGKPVNLSSIFSRGTAI